MKLGSFVAKKQRHVKAEDSPEIGDAWVFVAIDEETKLIPAYTVGKRNRETTYGFLTTLRDCMALEHRLQITTDGFHFYRKGVEDVFAGQADFAQMIKIYGDYGQHDSAGRYSPSPMIETIMRIRDGRPDPRQHLYQFRRTAKPHDAPSNPQVHPFDECVLKEAGQPESRMRSPLCVLQLPPDT